MSERYPNGSEANLDPSTAPTRRTALSVVSWTAFAAAIGCPIPFKSTIPQGLFPMSWAQSPGVPIPGKHPGLTILNERPINVETPAHLLNQSITPSERLFVRNNGHPPEVVDAHKWRLAIKGEAVKKEVTLSLNDLKTRYEHVSYSLVLECAGNGRSEFFPAARGNQWSTGAVGCVRWTGVALKDVLEDCSLTSSAVYVAYEGADTHLSGDPKKRPISRGVPIAKALDPHCLLAWAMNDKPIPALHGHPLRLVIPGYPGSCSGKWLTTLLIRDQIHDGAKMGGQSYRVPCQPVRPGDDIPHEAMCIIEEMPVKSLITSPKSGSTYAKNGPIPVMGHAWTGKGEVTRVHLSSDFGATWHQAILKPTPNPYAWQQFEGVIRLPGPGYYEIWARAEDSSGRAQPMVLPGWNPKGYLNNACHRIALRIEA